MKNYVLLILLLTNSLYGMEQEKKEPLKIFVIPGLKDKGLSENYITQITGISGKIQRIKTPTSRRSLDLGQTGCMKYLQDALEKNEEDFIIYANSQGTATVLNFFSQNPQHKDQCKGMILEAILASGNSAIYHRIMGPKKIEINPTIRNFLKKIPYFYYVGPYLAKIYFSHSPAGDQPIKLVKQLTINGPIIIVHSKQDPTLSYDDARAIYYALQKKENTVYFISKNGDQHIDIFRDTTGLINDMTIKKILSYHKLSPERANQKNLNEHKPNPIVHQNAYDELITKEQRHIWVKRGLSIASLIMTYKIIKVLSNKLLF